MRSVFFILFLFCGKIFACTCAYEWTTEPAFRASDIVFSGRVIGSDKIEIYDSVRKHAHHRMQYRFRIDEGYKGIGSDTSVLIYTGVSDGDCGFHFFAGIKYIVFGYASKKDGTFSTNICTATALHNPVVAAELHDLATKKQSAATDSLSKSVTIHFYYGSKPARGYKDTETKYFGGIHGGHVFLQIDSTLFSFVPAGSPIHIFAHKRKRQSAYTTETAEQFYNDTAGGKFTSITFPVSDSQYAVIQNIKKQYLDSTPYDYAFFGMRCAAAAYDVLGQAGVVKKRSNFTNVCRNFYPKRMRKRFIKRAKKENLKMIQQNGRPGRKWEKD